MDELKKLIDLQMSEVGFLVDEKRQELLEPVSKLSEMALKLKELEDKIGQMEKALKPKPELKLGAKPNQPEEQKNSDIE